MDTTKTPTYPLDDTQDSKSPTLPPHRYFKVSRPGFQTITIAAHAIEYGDSSVGFFDFVLFLERGKYGMYRDMRRCIIGPQIEVEEILVPATTTRVN